jgi:rubrerythrin
MATNLPPFLDERLQRLFLSELLSTPRGKSTLLSQLADAEGGDGGELDIFGHILDQLDDEEVKKLVRVHKEDEERHERLYQERARATGVEPFKLPANAHLLRRLDNHVGFFSKPVTDRKGVADAYLLLLVIEERAVKQFDRYKQAFLAAGDADTAAVIDGIKADEGRHLRYCEAISKRYSENEDVRQQRLAELRALESKCFDEVQAINLRFLVDNGFVGHTFWTKALWSTLSKVAESRLPPEFKKNAPTAAVAAAAA